MPRTRYASLIYFLLLSFFTGLVQSIARLMTGSQVFALEVFKHWFLIVSIISLVQSVLLLGYYRSQQYWFPFYTGIAFTISSLCYAIIVYLALVSGSLAYLVLPMFHILMGLSIVYGTSLVFSSAGRQFWLKAAGMPILINGLVFVSVFLWSTYTKAYPDINTSERVAQWTSFAGCLVPLFFILHFRKELRRAIIYPSTLKEKILRITVVLAWIAAIPFGVLLLGESRSSVYWANHNFMKTKELAQLFEARIFIGSKGDTLRYRLLKPLDYDTSRQYPIVINLPYGGQPGTDTIRQIEGAGAAQLLSGETNRKKYPAFLFVPNCPPGSGWGGIPGYPSVDSLVYEAIESLDSRYKIDPKRRYVTGISRGGYGAWNFICTRPDLFAAAIPICGGGNPSLASNARYVAVWAFHGEKDINVPVSGSRDMISAIRQAGGNPRYTEFPDEGHNIGYQAETTPGLWDWLFAQQKK
jgi:hypothetical protein